MAIIESERGALAGAIRDLVSAVPEQGDSHDWEFQRQGPAVRDWAENEVPSGWGDQPLQDAYRTGAIFWYVVSEQALCLSDLLGSGR